MDRFVWLTFILMLGSAAPRRKRSRPPTPTSPRGRPFIRALIASLTFTAMLRCPAKRPCGLISRRWTARRHRVQRPVIRARGMALCRRLVRAQLTRVAGAPQAFPQAAARLRHARLSAAPKEPVSGPTSCRSSNATCSAACRESRSGRTWGCITATWTASFCESTIHGSIRSGKSAATSGFPSSFTPPTPRNTGIRRATTPTNMKRNKPLNITNTPWYRRGRI